MSLRLERPWANFLFFLLLCNFKLLGTLELKTIKTIIAGVRTSSYCHLPFSTRNAKLMFFRSKRMRNIITLYSGMIFVRNFTPPDFRPIYPSRRHNSPPTLEMIIRNFPKKFKTVNNFPKCSTIFKISPKFWGI